MDDASLGFFYPAPHIEISVPSDTSRPSTRAYEPNLHRLIGEPHPKGIIDKTGLKGIFFLSYLRKQE